MLVMSIINVPAVDQTIETAKFSEMGRWRIVERDIPADLDQPLAAFDPQAVPAEPRQPVRPVAPLRAPALAKGERIDTVELPHRPGEDTPSIESLLRRLEQGTRRPQRVATR